MANLGFDDVPPLRAMSASLRRWIIEQSLESNVGHIGSALSIVDIVTALWGKVLREPGTSSPTRDRFILAKGHAALTLYGALRWKNLLNEREFHSYCRDGSRLGVHPEHALPGVDVSTGSLGQGLSIGCGLAYGLRQKRMPCRVFVLMSDAECNEGQVWEAVMFAAHHHLFNLTAIVDVNGLQAMGHTKNVIDLAPMAEKWRAFGWEARDVPGHDIDALVTALNGARSPDRPRVLLAHTVLGKGVSFMEDRLEWHYRNLTAELAAQALRDLEAQE